MFLVTFLVTLKCFLVTVSMFLVTVSFVRVLGDSSDVRGRAA